MELENVFLNTLDIHNSQDILGAYLSTFFISPDPINVEKFLKVKKKFLMKI